MDGHTVLRCVFQFYSMSDSLSIPQICCRYIHGRTHAPRALHQPLSTNTLPCEALTSCKGLQSSTRFPEQALFPPTKLIILIPPPPPEPPSPIDRIDTTPKKLEWRLSPKLRAGVRFAETRISDLICQNDCQALEFKGYGKNFITSHGFSPDAFVQMAFQAAYFGLYGECYCESWLVPGSLTMCVLGRIECVYEPAMTKAFLHGRTEAIRSVQPESVEFTKVRDLLVI